MGKKKEPEPEPEPEKIFRKLGENLSIEVSDAEKKFRNKNRPESVDEIPTSKLKCTVCQTNLSGMMKKGNEPYVHTLLGVLMCQECATFYGDGFFSADEDGDDKYCRWCGQGGTLYLCSACSCAFCKKCIRQNLERSVLKAMESDSWKCLVCDPKPLFDCRTICWTLQEHAAKETKNDETGGELDSSTRRDKGKKKEELSLSRKRKAVEVDDDSDVEISSKRLKDSESKPVRKTRNHKEKSTTDETANDNKTSSRRSGTSNNGSPLKDPKSKSNKLIEEITLSGDETKNSPRKSTKLKDKKKESNERRSSRDSSSKINLTPESSSKKEKTRTSRTSYDKKSGTPSSDSPATPSSKNKKQSSKSKPEPVDVIPIKRSQRTSKKPHYKYDDSDSDATPTKPKSKGQEKPPNTPSKISLGKNADRKVVEASRYINSALKDVSELTTLISVRCDKLCSKSLQSHSDVLYVFNKMKKLIDGVHTNLNLIEKGLDTKVSWWNGDKDEKSEKIETSATDDVGGDPKQTILDDSGQDVKDSGAPKETEHSTEKDKCEDVNAKGEILENNLEENGSDVAPKIETVSDAVTSSAVPISTDVGGQVESMDVDTDEIKLENESIVDSTKSEQENNALESTNNSIARDDANIDSAVTETEPDKSGVVLYEMTLDDEMDEVSGIVKTKKSNHGSETTTAGQVGSCVGSDPTKTDEADDALSTSDKYDSTVPESSKAETVDDKSDSTDKTKEKTDLTDKTNMDVELDSTADEKDEKTTVKEEDHSNAQESDQKEPPEEKEISKDVDASNNDCSKEINGIEDLWDDSAINNELEDCLVKVRKEEREEVSSTKPEENNVKNIDDRKESCYGGDGTVTSENAQEVVVRNEDFDETQNLDTHSNNLVKNNEKNTPKSERESVITIAEASKDPVNSAEETPKSQENTISPNKDCSLNGAETDRISQVSKDAREDLNKSTDSTSSTTSRSSRPDDHRSSEKTHHSGDRHHPHSGDRGRPYQHQYGGWGRDQERDRWSGGDWRDRHSDHRRGGGQYGQYNKPRYDDRYGGGGGYGWNSRY